MQLFKFSSLSNVFVVTLLCKNTLSRLLSNAEEAFMNFSAYNFNVNDPPKIQFLVLLERHISGITVLINKIMKKSAVKASYLNNFKFEIFFGI